MEPGTAMLLSSLISGGAQIGSGILVHPIAVTKPAEQLKHRRKLTELAATTVPG